MKQNNFLTCFWRFLRSNTLEQLEFKLEKITGIYKRTGKVRKVIYNSCLLIPSLILCEFEIKILLQKGFQSIV
jgi:hypothetical protein